MPVEAADLAALSEPWGGEKNTRELLFMSPAGLARYWPDVRSPRRFTDVDLRKEVLVPGQVVSVIMLATIVMECSER